MLDEMKRVVCEHYLECNRSVSVSRTALWKCDVETVNNVCSNIGTVRQAFCVIDSYNNTLGWIRVSTVYPTKINASWKHIANIANRYAMLREEGDVYVLYQACVNVNAELVPECVKNYYTLDWLYDLISDLYNKQVQQQITNDDYAFEEAD